MSAAIDAMTAAVGRRPEGRGARSLLDLVGSVDAGAAPRWLADLRLAASARVRESGLPTARDEEWRLTKLKPIVEGAFMPARAEAADGVDAARVDALAIPGMPRERLVFVNGVFAPQLSTAPETPAGVTVAPLDAQLHDRLGDLLERQLGRHARVEADAFTALNTALGGDITLVHVPRGVVLEQPLYVLHITAAGGDPVVTHPRTLIIAEPDSGVTVVEDYVGLDDEVYLTNAVTEIDVAAGADVRHYLIERESPRGFNVSTLGLRQGERSHFESHSVLLGGSVVRNNINPVLDGPGAHSVLNGLYVGRDQQQLDNHMRVEHAKPHCESRQYYKGILTDSAHGIFTGRIIVAQDAQKTDAIQSNASLLLSDRARSNAKPQLEIYADDVRCTHGATIGELDDNAIFYLRARGLGEADARGMLVHAFASESLDRMAVQPIRDYLAQQLLERLPGTPSLRNVLAE